MAAFQIHQDGPIALTFPFGPVIHAQDLNILLFRFWQLAKKTIESRITRSDPFQFQQFFSDMSTDIDAQILLLVKNSKSLTRIPCDDLGKLRCKCPFETTPVMAKESFYLKFQQHGILSPRKIDGITIISAMKAAACCATHRASCQLDRAFQPKRDLVILDIDLSNLELPDIQKE